MRKKTALTASGATTSICHPYLRHIFQLRHVTLEHGLLLIGVLQEALRKKTYIKQSGSMHHLPLGGVMNKLR